MLQHQFLDEIETISNNYYETLMSDIYILLQTAPESGHQCRQHRIQHPDHGVGQVHLREGEGRWPGPGGHHRPQRLRKPHQTTHLCRLSYHEPCQQGHCPQRWEVMQFYLYVNVLEMKKSKEFCHLQNNDLHESWCPAQQPNIKKCLF